MQCQMCRIPLQREGKYGAQAVVFTLKESLSLKSKQSTHKLITYLVPFCVLLLDHPCVGKPN